MDPADRVLRAQLGAHSQWANELDPTSRTAKARAAADDRFVKQTREKHPDATDEQIARMAEHLRKAHYKRMGLASGKKRRERAASQTKAA